MLDVVHVMGRMAPGGTENQLVGMLQAAHNNLWNATLCVLSSGHELSERVRESGVPVVELDGAGRSDPRRFAPFRRLTAEADVVHSSLWGANAFTRLASQGPRRAPVVISERGVEDHRHPAQKLIDRTLVPITSGFIGNSPAVTDFIAQWHGIDSVDQRLFEIRNGIDTQVFHSQGRSDSRRAVRRMVAIGRLVPLKRFDYAISLLEDVARRIPTELVIVGDGTERRRLTQLSSGLPVRFLGHVSDRQELASVLRSADLMVMPSRTEGLPNVVIEALACGVRVVVSDIPGTRPLEGPGVSLVPDDRALWLEALVRAAESEPIDASVQHPAVRSFELVAKEHLEVFVQALEGSGWHAKRGHHG